MKAILKLEEVGMFALSIFLVKQLHFAWWWFPVFLLAPDISAIGYLVNNWTGAILYNLFHHKGVAIVVYMTGVYWGNESLAFAGTILFGHSSMDRIFGYGLKYFDGFQFTHLGKIGKQ